MGGNRFSKTGYVENLNWDRQGYELRYTLLFIVLQERKLEHIKIHITKCWCWCIEMKIQKKEQTIEGHPWRLTIIENSYFGLFVPETVIKHFIFNTTLWSTYCYHFHFAEVSRHCPRSQNYNDIYAGSQVCTLNQFMFILQSPMKFYILNRKPTTFPL